MSHSKKYKDRQDYEDDDQDNYGTDRFEHRKKLHNKHLKRALKIKDIDALRHLEDEFD